MSIPLSVHLSICWKIGLERDYLKITKFSTRMSNSRCQFGILLLKITGCPKARKGQPKGRKCGHNISLILESKIQFRWFLYNVYLKTFNSKRFILSSVEDLFHLFMDSFRWELFDWKIKAIYFPSSGILKIWDIFHFYFHNLHHYRWGGYNAFMRVFET